MRGLGQAVLARAGQIRIHWGAAGYISATCKLVDKISCISCISCTTPPMYISHDKRTRKLVNRISISLASLLIGVFSFAKSREF
jgi:hypothetical protein